MLGSLLLLLQLHKPLIFFGDLRRRDDNSRFFRKRRNWWPGNDIGSLFTRKKCSEHVADFASYLVSLSR